MKILIAENNSGFQLLYERIMKHKCYEYEFACDYSQAIKLINNKRKQYDLCLFGFDLCYIEIHDIIRKIRNKTKYLPIMGITGTNQIKDDTSFFDDLLKKPFQINDLYSKIKKLTVKKIKIKAYANKEIEVEKEMPMDQEELKKIIELDKKGLAILVIENGTQRFVVHKNIQNKMTHKLIGEGKEVFEFLDRGDNPANCHLYKCNLQTNRLLLTPDEFKKRLIEEDRDIEKYISISDQKYSDE